MKIGRGALLCGALLVGAARLVTADEVDDLLAGKPVRIDQAAAPAVAQPGPSPKDRAVVPLETFTLESPPPDEQTFWDPAIEGQLKPKFAHDGPPQHERKPAPSTNINLVPEPSAIALAVGALLYFLIFFRRRHLA
jgi:hypothetical protein